MFQSGGAQKEMHCSNAPRKAIKHGLTAKDVLAQRLADILQT